MRTLHVGLRVTDMERSIAFYTSVGYEVLGRVRAAESVSLTMLELPDDEFVSLELVHDRGHARVDPTGLSHLVINLHALDETITDLIGRESRPKPPPHPTARTNSGRPG